MAFSLFNNTNNKKNGLIIVDVASGSVGVGIVIFEVGQKPRIIFSDRDNYPIEERVKNKRVTVAMEEGLSKLMNRLFEKGIPLVSKVEKNIKFLECVCCLSSPWYVSTSRVLHFKFSQTSKITPEFIKDVIAHEEKTFTESIAKDATLIDKDHNHKAIMIEGEILSTLIDGYPIDNILGRKASEFEMVLYLSAIPKSIKQIIENHIHKHLPAISLNFHSLNTVYFSLLSKLFPNDNSFMMTHISGETTDISVIKNGVIIESISFPLGRNFIIRRLLQEVPGITPSIAMSMIRINSDGHDMPKVSERIKKILQDVEEDWVHLFFDSVDELKRRLFIPVKVFILAGDDSAELFANIVTDKKQPIRGPGTPIIIATPISTNFFEKLIEHYSSDSENEDFFIKAEALFSEMRYFKEFRN